MLPKDKLERLQTEYAILHLIYHRNHNQHRVAIWWRYLNMVHRGVRKVLRGIYEVEEAKKIKRREQLQKEVVVTANHLLLRVMSKAFHHFHGVIALGQFVNLGLVLVANLSALRALLQEIEGVGKREMKVEEPLPVEVDDDIGEEVAYELVSKPPIPKKIEIEVKPEKRTPVIDIDHLSQDHEKKKKKKSKLDSEKKKKKKKSKSVMDDIFG